jgi:hypothetical protein
MRRNGITPARLVTLASLAMVQAQWADDMPPVYVAAAPHQAVLIPEAFGHHPPGDDGAAASGCCTARGS